jgi:hypothetical protein
MVPLPELCFDLVEVVERIFERQLPHAAEPRPKGELPELGLGQPARTQPLAPVGQRSRHAVHHTESVEEGGERPGVLLWLVRAVDVQAKVGPARPQRLADCAQEAPRVDRVVNDIEGRDQIVLAGDCCGRVEALKLDPGSNGRRTCPLESG